VRYWYTSVLMGLTTYAIMLFIQFYMLNGEDIILYCIKRYKGKK